MSSYRSGTLSPKSPTLNSPRTSHPHYHHPSVITHDVQSSYQSPHNSSDKDVLHSHPQKYTSCSSDTYAYATPETHSDFSGSDLSPEWKPLPESDASKPLHGGVHIDEWVPPRETLWFILVAFLAQSFRGFGPGFSRYLQRTAGFRSLELVSVRNGTAVVLLGPYILYKMGFGVFRLKNLWVLALAWIPAQIASFYSAQFTYSYYLKLIDLATPFFVAIIARGLLKKRLPPYTLPAMILTAIGAATSLTAQLLNTDNLTFVSEDLKGMALGVTSAFCVACGLVFYQTVETKFPSEAIFWLQNVLVFSCTFPLSMGLDRNWETTWRGLSNLDIGILCLQISFYMVGLWLQIIAIRGLGAPLVSTILAWGFVVALLFGMSPLLNEKVNAYNIVGAVIVTITVTAYLVYQYTLSKRVSNEAHRASVASYRSLSNGDTQSSDNISPKKSTTGRLDSFTSRSDQSDTPPLRIHV